MYDRLGSILLLATAYGAGVFFYRRGLRYLQFFQQEDYESRRFAQWYMDRKAHDRKASLIAFAAAVATFALHHLGDWLIICLNLSASACLGYVGLAEEDPRATGKLSLKMTERAKRIFYLSLAIYFMNVLVNAAYAMQRPLAISFVGFWILQIFFFQAQPFILILANSILNPYEKNLQEGFAEEARAILRRVHPFIIGITGSYGKTSSKVILTEILNSVCPTFTTPRSINSYMGVTREIRDRLKPQHKYAVIEMGAYYAGSIQRMCSLTPPNAAIVTAVGEMHLERFGSADNVFRAKSELPQALGKDGLLVLNGDYQYCRQMAADTKAERILFYGLDEQTGVLDAYMHDIAPIEKGTNFTIRWGDKEYQGFTQLLGRPMLSNILACFTMACAIGLNPELVLAVIRNVKTESNRLEPVRAAISSMQAIANGQPAKEGTILRLNDAYNSNPKGFAGALEVLDTVPGKRKILVTPGMIELGERQYEENKRAAEKAAAVCDLVLVVGKTNEKALLEGLNSGGMAGEKFRTIESMQEALSFLAAQYCEDGDVVLIENDLPDLYEAIPTF